MDTQLHVVLGASGVIGQAVAKELTSRRLPMRLVERPQATPSNYFAADLRKEEDVVKALTGASHVYVCVGIPYSAALWQKEWPIIMKNVLSAAEQTGTKVVFFDNNYMYGPSPLQNPMREDHPQEPESKKGKVRKEIADMALAAHKAGKVQVVIGRAADFYGPGAKNSLLYITVLARMLEGKNPQWLGKPELPHSFSYVLDNGRALVTLALDEHAYGQVWHLPVSTPTLTVTQVVEKISAQLKKEFKLSVVPKIVLTLLAPFVLPIKEQKEMLYQTEYPYVFSDEKFRAAYPDFVPTSFDDGIRAMIASFL